MNTIRELAADIARELRDDRSRWTTKTVARDRDGFPVLADDKDAVCWCLMGHILKRIPNCDAYRYGKAFFDAAGVDADESGFSEINDGKSVDEIIQLCDQVAAL